MRKAVLGGLLLGFVLSMAWSWQGAAQDVLPSSAPSRDTASDSRIIALALGGEGENRQQVVLVDPRMQVMAVYHISRDSGEIVLKSVRNFTWDMQLEQYNGAKPLPEELRALSRKHLQ
jgi:hypothetical protein